VPVPVTVLAWILAAVVLALTGAWAGLEWWRGALAAVVALVAVLAVVARTTRRLGGVTGDVFGASIEVALAAILGALA
jgi:adenosylcobinamide-GDP ribazoletransferase